MLVREIVKATRGKLLSGDPAVDIETSDIFTDSRDAARRKFFVALKGQNFDGNDFVSDVLHKGARGAIITTYEPKASDRGKVIVRVKDTTKALQDIAASVRSKARIPVVGVTGSNGKTTAKEMIAAVLSAKYDVLKNEGTKNNHIGLPQTLLKLKKSHEACVLELGTNHNGEIKTLAAIARPTIAVMTNIGPSHLEFLKDLDGVFAAKKEILSYLRPGGVLVLNGDDEYLARIKSKRLRIVRYGFGGSCDIKAKISSIGRNNIKFIVNGEEDYELNLLGVHNIYNALSAIAVGMQLGVSYNAMKKALYAYRPPDMRLNLSTIGGIDIINDTYNSNPLSMQCALETIRYYPARSRWVVSGDMLELGKKGEHFHKLIGEKIARSDVEGLITIGKLSEHTLRVAVACGMPKDNAWHCKTHDAVTSVLKKVAKKGDVILLKASRGMRLENVIAQLDGRGHQVTKSQSHKVAKSQG